MSTDLFINSAYGEDTLQTKKSNSPFEHEEIDAETLWLIKEIIKPELPNISDNVSMCLDLLNSDQVYKMPISNGAQEAKAGIPRIKGIVSRQREYIVDFQVLVSFPDFQNGKTIPLKMMPQSKFILKQFEYIVDNLRRVIHMLDELETMEDVHKFVSMFTDVVNTINTSIDLLNAPPTFLTYPENNNITMKEIFGNHNATCDTPTNLLSLDLILVKNELCIDFRNLKKVTRKPWANIDPTTRRCFIDRIKDELTLSRNKNMKYILEENGLTVEDSNFINNILNSAFKSETTTTLLEAQDYLRRGATFSGIAVVEESKIMTSTSDPILICISSKLHGLKFSIDNHYNNLKVHH